MQTCKQMSRPGTHKMADQGGGRAIPYGENSGLTRSQKPMQDFATVVKMQTYNDWRFVSK